VNMIFAICSALQHSLTSTPTCMTTICKERSKAMSRCRLQQLERGEASQERQKDSPRTGVSVSTCCHANSKLRLNEESELPQTQAHQGDFGQMIVSCGAAGCNVTCMLTPFLMPRL
jgi:hypothetical protein